MAADRGDRPRPETAMNHAEEIAARARQRGGEAGRLRRRQLEITLVIAAQCGLAATLSWALAHEVLDRPAPIFAPSAAVATIVAALGQRARRTAELLLGVGLGLFIGDVLLLYIGFGPWQLGLVVALAIAVALVLTGKSGALVGQAGSSAVLIATMAYAQRGLEWARIIDAVVGAIVGLVVVAVLIPFNPIRILDRAAAPLTETLNAQLRQVSRALAERDPDRAVRALDRLRGTEADLARLHEALDGAEEAATIAPVRWHRRADVERYQHGIRHLELVTLESRELTRWAATSLQYGEPVPEELSAAVERLAEAVRLLPQEARKTGPFEQTRDAVLDVARLAGTACRKGLKEYADAMVIQLSTAASDLLRATGYEPDTANRMVREAVNP